MTAQSAADEDPSGEMLQCNKCPKTFRYKSERIRHEMSHSPGFECETCCKKFSFISALRRHQKQHKRVGSVKCEECNRKFRDEELLKRHYNYAHKGTFECSKCNGAFSSEQALHTHMKTHRPASERRFKCNFLGCSKSFNFSHHLKHHELTHTNTKQHYCSVCHKGFIQLHHLKAHLKTHDSSVSLHCNVSGCKKTFSTEYAKKRHMAIHKIKPDSGISSDSNSCDADASVSPKEYADFILCASCGENVVKSNFSVHSLKCGGNLDVSFDIEPYKDDLTREEKCGENVLKSDFSVHDSKCRLDASFEIEPYKNDPMREENTITQSKTKDKKTLDKEFGDCKSALGDCIMSANTCVCAQMTRQADENNYDFSPISDTDTEKNNNIVTMESNNNIYFIDRYSENMLKFFDNKVNEPVHKTAHLDTNSANNESSKPNSTNIKSNTPTSVSNLCEGCECANTCNIKEPANCKVYENIVVKETSNVVYTSEGVVKIKDVFDVDISFIVEPEIKADDVQANNNVQKESDEFVSFGTCRDVIGNCIVGGSEGCLCARMMMDEQQAMAQEIDDITPVPKTESHT